jgi:hypothetical protein
VGVNEIVAVTKAPATLELSLTRRSKSDGVMRDRNPEFVLSEAISPEVENPLKTAEITFTELRGVRGFTTLSTTNEAARPAWRRPAENSTVNTPSLRVEVADGESRNPENERADG